MSNLKNPLEATADGVRAVRVAERAGAVADYGRLGKAKIVPPAPGPRQAGGG